MRTVAPQGVWTWRANPLGEYRDKARPGQLMMTLEVNFVRLSECVPATGAQPVAARSDVSTIYWDLDGETRWNFIKSATSWPWRTL
jgi:hypothetical protein